MAIKHKAATKKAAPEKKAAVKRRLKKEPKKTKRKRAVTPADDAGPESLLKKAPPAKMPQRLLPMLATLVDKPFDEPGWIYEVKWDGYRALAFCSGKEAELKSRNEKSFSKKFYPVTEALQDWNIHAVVDGEIVVIDEQGISDFTALQNWRSEADGILLFYVFDLIWYQGRDLSHLPLTERKAILESIVPEKGIIRLSQHFESSGTEFFETAKETGLEGIIAKRADSEYQAGLRTKDWLKIKASRRQEAVIGGFTVNENTDKLFSALLVGLYEDDELVYTGKIGTGFNRQAQQELMQLFKPLITDRCPFRNEPDINKPSRFRPNPPQATATWLKPQLVCEVSFAEITPDGVMRHPSFVSLRSDKAAKEVTGESPEPAARAIHEKKISGKAIVPPAGKRERRTFLNPAARRKKRAAYFS